MANQRTSVTESRLPAQRDVADAAHAPRFSRIWHGRAAAEGDRASSAWNGYIAQMNKTRRGSEQDDPYSDFWMLRIEDKLDQTKTTLQTLREQVTRHWRRAAGIDPGARTSTCSPSSCRCSSTRSWVLRRSISAGRLRRHRPQADPRPPHRRSSTAAP